MSYISAGAKNTYEDTPFYPQAISLLDFDHVRGETQAENILYQKYK